MAMNKSVCLIFLVVVQCYYGYPTKGISSELIDDTVIQNDTNIITDSTNTTSHTYETPNTSSSNTTQGFSELEVEIQSIWDILLHLEELIDRSDNPSNTTDEMLGTSKKVVTKVKEGFNKVKDKVKGGFDKVKNKVKVGIDKIKDKVGKIKDKIGTGGGGGGGTGGGGYGYRDNYYRRPYDRPTSSGNGGGGNYDLTVVWVFLGLAIAGIIGTVLYFMIKAF